MGLKKDMEASEEFFRRNESEEAFMEEVGYISGDVGGRKDSNYYSTADIREVVSKRLLEGRFFSVFFRFPSFLYLSGLFDLCTGILRCVGKAGGN